MPDVTLSPSLQSFTELHLTGIVDVVSWLNCPGSALGSHGAFLLLHEAT